MRRTKRLAQKQKINVKYKYFLSFFLIFSFILFGIFLRRFYSIDKFIVLNKLENGGGEILIIDPKSDIYKKYFISPEALLESSREYGQYKLQNLWTLAEKENIRGELVVESVAKNYFLPIYLWNESKFDNLDFFQKIKLNLVLKNNSKYELEFEDYELKKSILIDFLSQDIQESNISLEIEDLAGNQEVVDTVSVILNNLGTKISAYSKGYQENLDCVVFGSNKEVVFKISKIFKCKQEIDSKLTNSIKIRLGADFAKRF